MSELKACPFCGGELKLVEDYYDGNLFRTECQLCLRSYTGTTEDDCRDREKVIALVNTRPIESSLESQIASQQETIRKLTEDAERLSKQLEGSGFCCNPHDRWLELFADDDTHDDDCPVTLHRALMSELKGDGE